ncbi:MAG: AMP-binding protein [Candidatus Omnitrophota bacterium]
MLIHKRFQDTTNKFPDKTCLQYKEANQYKIITYRQVETQSLKIANFLIINNINPGDTAVLISENCYAWPIIYLGIMFSGATCIPVDPQVKKREIENILLDSQAKIIFISETIYQIFVNFPELEKNLIKIIVIKKDVSREKYVGFEKIIQDYETQQILPEIEPSNLASILYTSGTTSNPKGVCISHYNFCSDVDCILKTKLQKPNDNYISILPLYHTYAFTATFLVPFFTGGCITYINTLNTKEITQTIKETNITVMVSVPQMFNLIHKNIFDKIYNQGFLNRNLILFLINICGFIKFNFGINLGKIVFAKIHNMLGKNLRILNSGGAKLDQKVYLDLNKLGFNLTNGYGLTETSPVVTLLKTSEIKPGSVGKPLPGIEIKINNPDKRGVGEILIKGPNVMQGYFKRKDLTDEVIKDNWFYSGDLGFIDKNGYLYITARIKEVIVLSSGKNIYPDEIEEVLLQSPYIKEACVFSLADGAKEALHAAILPDIEYFKAQKEININQKIRWELENLSKNLANYKHIMSFSIEKDPLPRTHLGKIRRYIVKENYIKRKVISGQEKQTTPQQLSESSKKIIYFLSHELKKPVDVNDHLELDLGIDSLTRVELVLKLERYLGASLDENFIADIFTVNDLISKIEQFKNKEPIVNKDKQKLSWQDILNQKLDKNILEKIKLNQSNIEKILFFTSTSLLYLIFKIFWKIEIKNKEQLPTNGPYIICPNHASFLDGFAIGISLPYIIRQKAFFFGLTAYFENKIISWSDKFLKVIPIDPLTNLTGAMQAASFVLKNNRIMCIFPEGERSSDGNVKNFKKGVGILAKELNVVLVPVYIAGSFSAWGRGRKFPRSHPITVIFGKPKTWQEFKQNNTTPDIDEYQVIANGIRDEVIKLKTPD